MKKKGFFKILTASISLFLLITPIDSYATQDFEAQKLLPIESNNIDNWPPGPQISAYSAVLMDAESGIVLYNKNSDEKMYPASTTKLLTTLLAMEKEDSNLNDLVDFSYDAVMTVPLDASKMGMDAGEKMTLEECLYGILVCSANEVSNAVAEYVSGDIDTFVELMNKRAKELGCYHTHFSNPHGYTDPDHYTTAYDLALIGREFFKNELLCKICCSPSYHFYPTEYQPDDMILGSTNYFLKGYEHCDNLVGSKTGFTDESGNVLVSCAERNSMKLIAVVMKEETPYQYRDTNTLFDYGFSNFDKIKVSEYDTKYTVTDDSFFHSDSDVFGDSSGILSIDNSSTIILPKTIGFDDVSSELVLDESSDSILGTISYSYKGIYLGEADILFSKKNEKGFIFSDNEISDNTKSDEGPIFIYVNYIIYGVGILFVIVILISVLSKFLSAYHFAERRKASKHWRKRNKWK